MCRIAAWIGKSRPLEDIFIAPDHSLLEQSQHAVEAKLSVNGDGFGFAWYDGQQDKPGLYRDAMPAWSDGNLLSLCRMIRAPLFIAHVRASTIGETSRTNCHPFSHGRWSFCHNGQFPAFPKLRRQLEAALPDALYEARRGTTDSEMFFLTLLANGLDQNPSEAVRLTLDQMQASHSSRASRATLTFSDGHSLFACRYASDAKAPTLYVSDKNLHNGRILASEPLDGTSQGWTELPQNQLVEINSDSGIVAHPLSQARAA